MFVVKLLLSNFSSANRDKREVSVLDSLGCRICIMYPFDKSETPIKSKHDIVALPKIRLSRSQPSIYRKFVFFNNIIRIAKQVRTMKADCISCHDLTALFIGWVSTWGMKRKPILVYDAHEFEIGRNTDGKRGKIVKWLILKEEKFLLGRCAFSIMVNDSIADAVQKIYQLDKRPLVIRNIAPYWERDDEACKRIRNEFYQALNVTEDTFLVMYHGGVIRGRGIETLLEAVKADDNIAAVILGNGEENYMKALKASASEFGINHRVLFHPAVPIDILKDYVGAVNVGVTLAKNICANHYYMLPNKLFENIQSETPIIGSDFPEIRKIIDGYGVGLCCNPENVESIVACIEKLRNDKELNESIKNNLRSAKNVLCWENEKKVLEEAYRDLMSLHMKEW